MLRNMTRYGTAATKIRAMYGARLQAGDFQKIASLENIMEVAGYLKNHSLWGRAFQSADISALGRGRLEYILRQHYLGEYLRLLHYLNRDDHNAVSYPVLTTEIEQIMRYMRLASAGRVAEYAYDLPPFFNRHSRIHYEQLSQAESYEGMLAAVRQTDFYPALRALTPADGSFPDYLDVELAMRIYFFRSAVKQAGKGGGEGELFREWVGLQADWINITTLARVLRGYPHMRNAIARYLLPIRGSLKNTELLELIDAADEQEFLSILKNTAPGRAALRDGCLSVSGLETAAKRQQLRFCRRQMSAKPSVFTAIAYMQLLRNEMENLICVIECVRYRLPPTKTMEKMVLV